MSDLTQASTDINIVSSCAGTTWKYSITCIIIRISLFDNTIYYLASDLCGAIQVEWRSNNFVNIGSQRAEFSFLTVGYLEWDGEHNCIHFKESILFKIGGDLVIIAHNLR